MLKRCIIHFTQSWQYSLKKIANICKNVNPRYELLSISDKYYKNMIHAAVSFLPKCKNPQQMKPKWYNMEKNVSFAFELFTVLDYRSWCVSDNQSLLICKNLHLIIFLYISFSFKFTRLAVILLFIASAKMRVLLPKW